MNEDSVSVIIPAHNRPRALARAVASVLSQTCPPSELIVVDDGSEADLASVAALVEDSGHRFDRVPHGGVARARNSGAERARGRWLAFLDSDDLWEPDKLARHLHWLREQPELLRVSQTAEQWIRHGRPVVQDQRYCHETGDIFRQCLEVCCLSCSSVLLDRELFLAAGGFDSRYPVCEDYDLWIRLTHRHPVGWLDEALTVKHAGHADQLSKAFPAMDRFRVHALLKLWPSEGLSPERRQWVAEEVGVKAKTLMQGARKRGLKEAELYQSCKDWAGQPDRDQAVTLCRTLRATWQ